MLIATGIQQTRFYTTNVGAIFTKLKQTNKITKNINTKEYKRCRITNYTKNRK